MVDPPKCTPMACGVRWAKLPAVAITAKMAVRSIFFISVRLLENCLCLSERGEC